MEITVEQQPKSTIKLSVTVTPEEMSGYFKRALQQVANEVHISGFRKGKAPRASLEARVGKHYVAHQAMDLALTDSYYQAVTEKNLKPIGRPKTEVAEADHEKLEQTGMRYTATVAVLPEVKLGKYQEVRVKPAPSAFEEKLVDETIEQLRKGRADSAQVERAAKAGDRVEIDFVGKHKGKEVPGAKSENHPLVIGEDNFVPGFSEQVVGMKSGQVKEFPVKFPKDYHEQTLAGQAVEFTVTMRQVQEIKVPAFDDDFAKSFGANSADDLRKRLRENLEKEKADEARHQTEGKVVEKVVEQATVEIPDLLVDDEMERMIGELRRNIEGQGIPYDKYLEHLKKTEEDIRTEQRGEAERRVKTSLVLNTIQEAESLKPTDAQVKAELEEQLKGVEDEKAKQQVKGDEFKAYVTRVLGNRLVVDLLVKQAAGDGGA